MSAGSALTCPSAGYTYLGWPLSDREPSRLTAPSGTYRARPRPGRGPLLTIWRPGGRCKSMPRASRFMQVGSGRVSAAPLLYCAAVQPSPAPPGRHATLICSSIRAPDSLGLRMLGAVHDPGFERLRGPDRLAD